MLFLKRFFFIAVALIAVAGLVAAIEYFGGQPMGLFSGSRPANLGFVGGKFAPPSWKPNCVSSTVEKNDKHYIEPLAFSSSSTDAWNKLVGLVKNSQRTTVVTEKRDYLYAEFKSAGLGYVDDVEFALDANANLIHVRSASRLGIRDFDVNRKRIETIRASFGR